MRCKNEQSVVRSGWQRGQGIAGFTLVELMIVIVILGIAAAIVVPMTSSASSMQLRAAANMVAADLEYAKSLAIGTGQVHAVQFVDTKTYKIVDPTNTPVSHPIRESLPYVVKFSSDGRLDQVSVTSANFDGGSVVRFNYLGEPYNSSSALVSEGVITLTAGGLSKKVRVQPVTGFITISD
jgi:prepilin-type N-terminal cleavage/methylation domain-containing protein